MKVPGPRIRYLVSTVAGIILGLGLLAAGLGKLVMQTETFRVFYTPHTTFVTPAIAYQIELWLPPVEVAIGLLLILGIATRLAAVFASGMVLAFIVNNSWLLSQGLGQEACGCFGILDTLAAGGLSTFGALYMDIGMLVVGLLIVLCHPHRFLSVRPWFLQRKGTQDSYDQP